MTPLGAFTFVLHSHLPYVRLAGRWPHGEEWLHEAICETYVPLLSALYNLVEQGVRFKLTIGFTPVLIEQLRDPIVLYHLEQYLDTRIAAAKKDMRFFDGQQIQRDSPFGETLLPVSDYQLRVLAECYVQEYQTIKKQFIDRFDRDILGAFKRLQDAGYIEIMTSAATHAYLPLLEHTSSINAQIETAVAVYESIFERKPETFWLPECAYRPAHITDEATRPGIEYFLEKYGMKVFFSETHSVTGETPQSTTGGDALGLYSHVPHYAVSTGQVELAPRFTTYQPYFVAKTTPNDTVFSDHSRVAVIARNNATGQQVWSNQLGYPGDVDYREFHRKAGTSGFRYWRVTDDQAPLGEKDIYHPEWAALKVEQHAEHFAHLVGDLLTGYSEKTGQYGLVASIYDTELFGHWWYEGIQWIEQVLTMLASDPRIELVTSSQFIQEHPPTETLQIPESSWGAGGDHSTWQNDNTAWMWPLITEASARMEVLAAQFANPQNDEETVLNQAARELLLLQSSDWPFLITTEQAKDYAVQRFYQHLERFNLLCDGLARGEPDVYMAKQFYEQDNPFPNMDYRWFRDETAPDHI